LFPISSARGILGQPVPVYNWEVVIPDPPAALSQDVEGMSIKARDVAVPAVTGEGYDTRFGPFTFTHPGRKSYSRSVGLRFEESYNRPMIRAMKLWMQHIFDEEAGAGIQEGQLKANMWIRLLGPDSENEGQAGAIHVYEVFPKGIQDTPLSYAGDGQVFVSVDMGFNVWRWEAWPF